MPITSDGSTMQKAPSKALVKTKAKKQPIRRHIQHLSFVNGVHFFCCKSMSRYGLPTSHTQEIDIEDGNIRCSCEHHRFAHALHEPTLATPELRCKHLVRCVDWLERHDQMPGVGNMVAHRCVHCGMPDAAHEVCDERGHRTAGRICADCIQRAQMMNDEPLESTPADSEVEEAPPEYKPETVPDYEPEYSEEEEEPDWVAVETRGMMGYSDEVPPCEPERSDWDEMNARR